MRQNRRNTMYCPQEKALEMSNTLLAANRNAARSARKNKRHWHGRRRSARRTEEHLYEGVSVDNALEMADGFEECEISRVSKALAKVESDRKYEVFDRREGDRLNLYFRWARGVTEGMVPADRMQYIADTTPVDPYLISHAMLHLRFADGFRDGQWNLFDDRYWRTKAQTRRRYERVQQHDRAMIAKCLLKIVDTGQHDEFNRRVGGMIKVMRRGGVWEQVSLIRKFEGIHDIEAYTEQVMREGDGYTVVSRRVNNPVISLLEQMVGIKVI